MKRALSILLVLVMVCCMLPTVAFASEIQPRTIRQDGNTYFFQTFEELKELAAGTYSTWVDFRYNGSGELVITEDLALSENMNLIFFDHTVRVAENADFSGYFAYGDTFIVDGTAYFYDNLCVNTKVEVNGVLNYEDYLWIKAGTELIGVENMNPGKALWFIADAFSVDELNQAATKLDVTSGSRNVYYTVYSYFSELTESVEIPDGIELLVYEPLTIPAGKTLTVDNLTVWAEMTVAGRLFAYNIMVDIDENVNLNGTLEVIEDGVVESEILQIHAPVGSELSDFIPGVDLTIYNTTYTGEGYWLFYNTPTAVPGDMNGDDAVDDSDVATLLWYTLFPDMYEITANTDINGDGVTDDSDVAYLLWHTLFPDMYPLN